MSRFVPWPSLVLATLSLLAPAGIAHAAPCWHPPVSAPISDQFREPGCAWCPGNRGLEFATVRGAPVRAVATGRVAFAGTVVGRVYVVVRHGDGRRVTYGNLTSESYDVGDLVVGGLVLGRAAGAFHLGLRDGDRYIDPAPYIGRYVRLPRLIPVDGSNGNPAPPPRLSCNG